MVMQWLVKLAIATREEMGDYIRAFSEAQFSKEHHTPEVGGGASLASSLAVGVGVWLVAIVIDVCCCLG